MSPELENVGFLQMMESNTARVQYVQLRSDRIRKYHFLISGNHTQTTI
jgi:hypothetical protein